MKYAENYACPECGAYLLQHPTNADYKKCPNCGYCVKIVKRLK